MEMQLAALQLQAVEPGKELDERKADVAIRQQAQALSSWAARYLSEVKAAIEVLEVDPETLTAEQRQALADELEGWRFEEKFPGDQLAQLRWAILEEKRRVVRTLIKRIIVSKVDGPKKRKVTPILALDIENGLEFLTHGDQSPYAYDHRPFKITFTPEELGFE